MNFYPQKLRANIATSSDFWSDWCIAERAYYEEGILGVLSERSRRMKRGLFFKERMKKRVLDKLVARLESMSGLTVDCYLMWVLKPLWKSSR